MPIRNNHSYYESKIELRSLTISGSLESFNPINTTLSTISVFTNRNGIMKHAIKNCRNDTNCNG